MNRTLFAARAARWLAAGALAALTLSPALAAETPIGKPHLEGGLEVA
ncbi:MAG: hypothetical protein IT501_10865, partial [Rubrivivax sp.]|nr:hypothetical protein [Rubrivivax sp.]